MKKLQLRRTKIEVVEFETLGELRTLNLRKRPIGAALAVLLLSNNSRTHTLAMTSMHHCIEPTRLVPNLDY